MDDSHAEVDRIIHFLEYEVTNIRANEKRPGWTLWAIWVSLASLVWLLLSSFDNNPSANYKNCILVFYISSLLCDLFFILRRTFVSHHPIDLAGNRFELFDNTLATFLWILLFRQILLLYFTYFIFSPTIVDGFFYKISPWVFWSLSIVFISLCLLFYYFKIAIPKIPQKKGKRSIIFFSLCWSLFGVITLFRLYKENMLNYAPHDIRIGFILFGGAILILLLAKTRPQSVLTSQLDATRKKLSLGQIDIDSAKEKIDIIINGLKVHHVLHQYVENLLTIMDEHQELIEKHISDIDKVISFIEQSEKNLKATEESIDNIYQTFLKYSQEIKEVRKKNDQALSKLILKINMYVAMNPKVKDSTDTIITKIKERFEPLLSG